MIKVIKKEPAPEVVKTIVCQHCGVTLEYVPNDIRVLWSGRDISGGRDGGEGFDCPECRHQVITKCW